MYTMMLCRIITPTVLLLYGVNVAKIVFFFNINLHQNESENNIFRRNTHLKLPFVLQI